MLSIVFFTVSHFKWFVKSHNFTFAIFHFANIQSQIVHICTQKLEFFQHFHRKHYNTSLFINYFSASSSSSILVTRLLSSDTNVSPLHFLGTLILSSWCTSNTLKNFWALWIITNLNGRCCQFGGQIMCPIERAYLFKLWWL